MKTETKHTPGQEHFDANPELANYIAQLKQQNEELKAHEQEIRDCWTEERTDHNKAREEVAQLRADYSELRNYLFELVSNFDGDTDCTALLDSINTQARNLITKHTKV